MVRVQTNTTIKSNVDVNRFTLESALVFCSPFLKNKMAVFRAGSTRSCWSVCEASVDDIPLGEAYVLIRPHLLMTLAALGILHKGEATSGEKWSLAGTFFAMSWRGPTREVWQTEGVEGSC